MINEIIFMNGYGLYVWSSFIFTLSSFFFLYFIIKFQLTKEQKKFGKKFRNLSSEKGLSVLMISSELEEIIEGSNTVFILKDGETIAKYNNEEIKESNIIKDMAGA